MADPYFLKSLDLSGFRAYLHPKAFDLSKKRCVAIFASNGNGKSSVIDALEFMFSEDGTLERLGLRAVNNEVGPAALAHDLAEDARIEPAVAIDVVSGNETSNCRRPATGAKRPRPTAATNVNACFAVAPIIRGHALRTFVEVHKTEQRYADIANWLQLDPLVEVQKIFVRCAQIKAATDGPTAIQHVNSQLAKETGQALKTWHATVVLYHVNMSVLAPLDSALVLATLAASDLAYLELQSRAKAEANRSGLRACARSVTRLPLCGPKGRRRAVRGTHTTGAA